jgi:hypothetical protein
MNYWSFKAKNGKGINKDAQKTLDKRCRKCGKPVPIRGKHWWYCSEECYTKRNDKK